jgi:methylated-DNA-[protein]-cysteine S-methyltransferase
VLLALTFDDPVGQAIRRVRDRDAAAVIDEEPDPGVAGALAAYFQGRLEALDDLRVDPHGTPFQRHVWTALRRIPVRQTLSYKALAEAVGRPSAVRAVGAANGANPVAIVIPCHRVIGSGGRLVGYGGGLARKRWLLAHEGALTSPLPIED